MGFGTRSLPRLIIPTTSVVGRITRWYTAAASAAFKTQQFCNLFSRETMFTQHFLKLLDKAYAPVVLILIINISLHNANMLMTDRCGPVTRLPEELAW